MFFVKEGCDTICSQQTTEPQYRDERYHLFSQCLSISLHQVEDGQVWNKIQGAVDYCSGVIKLNVDHLVAYRNADETKYHMDPIDLNQVKDCHIVTLGIGHDVSVETKLKEKYGDRCKFQGADPIPTKNEEIYKPIGEYFQFAVGNQTRVENPNSEAYTLKDFSHVEFVEFLRDKAQVPRRQIIDELLVDIEYAEYAMLDYFYLNGKLDKAGYTVCQWNGEFHIPNDAQKAEFGKFIKQVTKDERYLFFHLIDVGHIRAYFVNVADQRCFDRYVKGRI
ncbi:hypothetical protein QR680_015497 [Steinernema hermaphroditum]|uniref:Methyltransferase FkbM domain-containing protein n=1 Tax=Steinernema hermaphroditum TaxID=289476 RepID=A0AA39H7W6_9BILA|nr:hypothetical protein QR680_015497 [Steinernema hermaphroditum]